MHTSSATSQAHTLEKYQKKNFSIFLRNDGKTTFNKQPSYGQLLPGWGLFEEQPQYLNFAPVSNRIAQHFRPSLFIGSGYATLHLVVASSCARLPLQNTQDEPKNIQSHTTRERDRVDRANCTILSNAHEIVSRKIKLDTLFFFLPSFFSRSSFTLSYIWVWTFKLKLMIPQLIMLFMFK